LTPLHLASQWGMVDLARFLVENGADTMARDKHGSTPLHWVSRGHIGRVANSADIAFFLIKCGADAKAHDNYGSTPLQVAEQRGDVFLARLLADHGTDATAQDQDQDRPLRGISRHVLGICSSGLLLPL